MPPKKKGVARGAGVDPAMVEQVKALNSLGYTNTHIAKQTGMSVDTVRRYIRREDADPAWEEAREKNVERFVDKQWELLWIIYEKTLVRAKDENDETKLKDLVLSVAIIYDKIMQAMAGRAQISTTTTEKFEVNLTITGNDESQHNGVTDSRCLHVIEGEVSGDGVRGGSGQDLYRLPGGCEPGALAEVRGCDSGLDLPEPARLRDPDADG